MTSGYDYPGVKLLTADIAGDGRNALQRVVVAEELSPHGSVSLLALFVRSAAGLLILVTDKLQLEDELATAASDADLDLVALGEKLELPVFAPSDCLRLQAHSVAKPWGQELWFSGIEQRGVCVVQTRTAPCPLPWLQAATPQQLSAWGPVAPILLKILDPKPEPVLGDLYLELHEEKQEVYVVTAIDPTCWPQGVGRIRIGFNAQKVAEFADAEAFKQDYLQAVQAYQAVRNRIDAAATELPAEVHAQESLLRQRMNEYTDMVPLAVGDVVVVPARLPHSLQHGVRVIEFQTPVYERKILSFAQRVVTQPQWDTESALNIAKINSYRTPEFKIDDRAGVKREKIVDFDTFTVWRCELSAGATLQLEDQSSYAMVMTISGEFTVAGETLVSEQAALLLGAAKPCELRNSLAEKTVLLLAEPRLHDS